jgi:hypothetical protein
MIHFPCFITNFIRQNQIKFQTLERENERREENEAGEAVGR